MLAPTSAMVFAGPTAARILPDQLDGDEGVALDVVAAVREVKDDRVEAATPKLLYELLPVEERVEFVPVHRVVRIESLDQERRAWSASACWPER